MRDQLVELPEPLKSSGIGGVRYIQRCGCNQTAFLLNLLWKKGDFKDSVNGDMRHREGRQWEAKIQTEVFSENENWMGIGTTSPSPPKPSASAHYPETNIPHTTYHTLSWRTLETPSSEKQKDPREVTFRCWHFGSCQEKASQSPYRGGYQPTNSAINFLTPYF